MSTRVSIAWAQDDAWHLYFDAFDDPPRSVVFVELRRVQSASLALHDDGGAALEFALPLNMFWRIVRGAAEARARGWDVRQQNWPAPPDDRARTVDRPSAEELRESAENQAAAVWSQLASDRPAVASRLGTRLDSVSAIIRRAVERTVQRGTDPLVAALEDMLRPAPISSTPDLERAAATTARELATLSRHAWDDDEEVVWNWWALARPTALERSPLEALRAGQVDAVRRLLMGLAYDGGPA